MDHYDSYVNHSYNPSFLRLYSSVNHLYPLSDSLTKGFGVFVERYSSSSLTFSSKSDLCGLSIISTFSPSFKSNPSNGFNTLFSYLAFTRIPIIITTIKFVFMLKNLWWTALTSIYGNSVFVPFRRSRRFNFIGVGFILNTGITALGASSLALTTRGFLSRFIQGGEDKKEIFSERIN